ncbi:hypothetical protein ACUSIJ_15685 [Pseudochelatococcus sp. B33]
MYPSIDQGKLHGSSDVAMMDHAHPLGWTRGCPAEEKPPRQALDTVVAARLWETSQHLTDVTFA